MRRRAAAVRTLLAAVCFLACGGTRPAPTAVSGGAALRPCPASPNCFSSEADESIAPFHLAVPAESAWPRVRAAVALLPGCRIVDTSPSYLRAECSSRIFGFVDDLEVLLRAAAQRLAVRSASRTGYSDLGVNRRRVERLRAALVEEGVLGGEPGAR